jgi:hypothetical protein
MPILRLTYAELGRRTGHNAEGARALARRRRWRIERGNDGRARVLVEEADLAVRPPGHPPGRPDGHGRPAARAEGKAETLERALADLAGWLDRATDELRELRRPGGSG